MCPKFYITLRNLFCFLLHLRHIKNNICSCAFFLFADVKNYYLQFVFILLSVLGLLAIPWTCDNSITQGTRNQWKVMPPINVQENDHTANLSNLRWSWWGRPTQIPESASFTMGKNLKWLHLQWDRSTER